jgi:CubicO group peptidase (beta-lactamase class C family)
LGASAFVARLALVTLATFGFNAAHAAPPAISCARDYPLEQGWTRADDPASAGFDVAALCAALETGTADASNPTNVHAVLVVRHDQIVAERYYRGQDKPIGDWFSREKSFGPDDLHDIRSISKSIMSLLFGIARGEGKLGAHAALDTPMLAFFPQYAEFDTPERRAVTLAHLLNMTPGWRWDESGSAIRWSNDETRMSLTSNPVRYVLSRPMAQTPGSTWVYNGGTTTLLAAIVENATATPIDRYAREKLFAPLGITAFEWRPEFHDHPSPYSGLRLRPRDLARIGRLLLNHGQWEGKTIVPADWVDASLSAPVATDDGLRYGYQWWSGTVAQEGRTLTWHAGFGNGGQRLFIVPARDLIVVITAGRYGEANNGRASMTLFRRIVAAMTPVAAPAPSETISKP